MDNYTKTTWVNGSAPALNAENLNKIENGIEASTEAVTALESRTATIESEIQTAKGTYGSINERLDEVDTELEKKSPTNREP